MLVNSASLRSNLFARHKRTLLAIAFVFVYAVSISYAVPPATPYQPGETLDPSCMPGDLNCFVQILPDQTGHAGEFLTTDGDVTSWAVLPAGYNDENAQDAVGTILSSEFSYDDLTPLISINTVGAAKITGTKTATFISDFSAAVQTAGDVRYAPINSGVTSFNGRTGAVSPGASDYTTSLVAEGTNLYFTAPRAVTALTGANISIFNNDAGYLTSYTETDPSVPSYAKSLTSFSVIQSSTDALYPTMSGTGATGTWGISVSGNAATVTNGLYSTGTYANPSWITSLAWSKLTGTPTTLFGYGITDAYTQTEVQNFFAGTTAITGYNKSNWDTAYGWGNHATQGYLTDLSSFSTTDLAEGTNLYYTNGRFDTRLAAKTTDDIAQGATNLYSQWSTATGGINYASGNVGVGTATPGAKFHVINTTGGVSNALSLGNATGGDNNGVRINFNLSNATNFNPAYIEAVRTNLGSSGATYIAFATANTVTGAIGERVRISEDGNLGIGTTNPGYKLDVSGDANFTGTINANAGQSNIVGATPFFASPSGYNLFRQGLNRSFNFDVLNGGSPVTAFTILQSGNIGMGITTPSVKLMVVDTANNTAFGIQGAGATTVLGLGSRSGLPAVQAHTAGFGGTTSLLLNPGGGNVGIGTTAPSTILDVQSPNAQVKVTSTVGANSAFLTLANGGGSSYVGLENSAGTSFGGMAYGLLNYVTGEYPIQFFTNSQPRMIVGSTGSVGIGTTAPSEKLDVMGTNAYVSVDGVGSNTGYLIKQSGVEKWRFDSLSASGDRLRILAGGSTEALTILQNGNVGIGTVSPNATLDVNGNIRNSSASQFIFTNNIDVISSSDTANLFTSTANAYINIGTGITTGNIKIGPSAGGITVTGSSNGGNVGIGVTSPLAGLHVAKVATGGIDDGNVVLRLEDPTGVAGQNAWQFQTRTYGTNELALVDAFAGTTRMLINSSGNVGIGTTSPSEILTISKNQNATTRVTISNTDTTNGSSRSAFTATAGGVTGEVVAIATATPGIYVGSVTAHSLNFFTNGATRMMIDSSGNAGIGTTAPSTDLGNGLTINTATGFSSLYFQNAGSGRGFLASENSRVVLGTLNTGMHLQFNTNGYERMRIADDGNVGIGKTPSYFLDINGNVNISNNGYLRFNAGDAQIDAISFNLNFSTWNGSAMTQKMTILSGGDVGIGTTSPSSKLTVVLPSGSHGQIIRMATSAGSYYYGLGIDNNGYFGIYDNDAITRRLVIAPTTGNVGIGTATPAYKLQVAGTLHAQQLYVSSLPATVGNYICHSGGAIGECSSDRRLKENIRYFSEEMNALELIAALRPAVFDAIGGDRDIPGFIAQDIKEILPYTVTVNSTDGFYNFSRDSLVPYLVKAVQETNFNVMSIDDLDRTNTWRSALIGWFANTTNGIENFVAGTLRARNQICIDDVCMTKEQLRLMIQNTGHTSSPYTPSAPEPEPAAPPAGTETPEEPVTPTEPAPQAETPVVPPAPKGAPVEGGESAGTGNTGDAGSPTTG